MRASLFLAMGSVNRYLCGNFYLLVFMTFTPDHLASFSPKLHRAHRCYVGYSGGLDSHVLLHSLVAFLGPQVVCAIHVNHQLSPNADHWQQHCEERCLDLGVELLVEKVVVESDGQGLENAARVARYAAFEKHLEPTSLLLLAHHADDQVETVLYRLLRGSGPHGLAGMPVGRTLGAGELLRPLLNFSRLELHAYAEQHELVWINDESNEETTFDRNFIRHHIVPPMAERWPDYVSRIAHSASLCRDNDQLVAMLAAQDLIAVYERPERLGWSISLDALQHLDDLRQANLLRHWSGQHHLPLPGHRAVDAVLHELLPAREDAEPLVSWSGVQVRRFQRRLYLLPLAADFSGEMTGTISWQPRDSLVLPDNSLLDVNIEQGRGLLIPDNADVEIRYRQGGERCKPQGRSGSNTLKKLFLEYGLEPWLRHRVPLIYVNSELAAVADLWVCEGFYALPDQSGAVIEWSFPE